MIECIVEIKDWLSPIGDLLLGLGTLLLGLAAFFGDILKLKKSKEIEKQTQDAKIKHEQFLNKMRLAQEALRIFNQVKSDIMHVRSPLTFEGDQKRLENMPEDNELIKKAKTIPEYGVKLLKLDDGADNWAEFNRFEPEFTAAFGECSAFQTFREIRGDLVHHIRSTIEFESYGRGKDDTYLIYATGSDNDERTQKLNDAIKEIEKICQPILRGDDDYKT